MAESQFPEYLDEEDITLARKEWILAGFEVVFFMDPETKHIFANVYDPEGSKSTRYLKGEKGVWLEVASTFAPVKLPLHMSEE